MFAGEADSVGRVSPVSWVIATQCDVFMCCCNSFTWQTVQAAKELDIGPGANNPARKAFLTVSRA